MSLCKLQILLQGPPLRLAGYELRLFRCDQRRELGALLFQPGHLLRDLAPLGVLPCPGAAGAVPGSLAPG